MFVVPSFRNHRGATVAVALLLAACSSPAGSTSQSGSAPPTPASASAGSASESPGGASPSASGASPSASGGSPSAASAGGTLAVTAQEYSFTAPASAPAGATTISLQNVGKEDHQAQLVKLNQGKTFQDLLGALATGDPSAAIALVTLDGGPTAVTPGSTVQTASDLTPGNYAFLCFFTTPEGVPHVAKGMVLPLEVTAGSSGGSLPTSEATVTAKDFTYEAPPSVTAGRHTFTFANQGPQPHEAGVIKLNAGVTIDQVKQALAEPAPSGSPAASASAATGPPPFTAAGGISGVSPGTTATFTVDLEAGAQYAFICFIPDRATGKPHAALGMVVAIPVQ
jgi:hypothetical protein